MTRQLGQRRPGESQEEYEARRTRETLFLITILIAIGTALFFILRFAFKSPRNFAIVAACTAVIAGGIYYYTNPGIFSSSASVTQPSSPRASSPEAAKSVASKPTAISPPAASAPTQNKGSAAQALVESPPAQPQAGSTTPLQEMTTRVEPSFDCAKAYSPAEIAICNDNDLAKLDQELSILYRKAKSVAVDQDAFDQKSGEALKWREENCFVKSCLFSWFVDRKATMQIAIAAGSVKSR